MSIILTSLSTLLYPLTACLSSLLSFLLSKLTSGPLLAMQQDLALVKGGKTSIPLSIANRKEFADYPLEGIEIPHPHDVCKLLCSDCTYLVYATD